MKALLISPAERPAVASLAERAPLALFPILGKELIVYWIEHLVSQGAKEILIAAADRPDQLRQMVEDGSRWGVKIEVIPELRELSVAEARTRYGCDTVLVADRLPTRPGINLFESYETVVRTAQSSIPEAVTSDRIGLWQPSAGIWVGLGAQISPAAKLMAPCWIGDHAVIGDDAVVGPFAIVERRSVIDSEAVVTNSIVGPDTFVGAFASVEDSIVRGDTLINWRKNSHAKVADRFLMASLEKNPTPLRTGSFLGSVAAFLALIATSPLAMAWVAAVGFRGQRILVPRKAVMPGHAWRSVDYYEFADATGFWRRWPQLWNVVRGEFAWVGNRPLNPMQAAELSNDFERLWLASATGVFSHADALECQEEFSDEARAHSAYYAAQQNWRLDAVIFLRILKQLCLPKRTVPNVGETAILKPKTVPVTQPISR